MTLRGALTNNHTWKSRRVYIHTVPSSAKRQSTNGSGGWGGTFRHGDMSKNSGQVHRHGYLRWSMPTPVVKAANSAAAGPASTPTCPPNTTHETNTR